MKSLNYDGLLNAVVNDLKVNGMYDEYPNICDYLWGGAHMPISSNHIAWNTAQGFYDWYDEDLEEAKANGDVEEVARIIVNYIDSSYDAHCEWYEDGDDKEAFDDIIEKCNDYISDINKEMLFEEMYPWGITKRVFENFLSACEKDFDKYDIVASKYSKKYDYDFTSKKTKKMVRTALGW